MLRAKEVKNLVENNQYVDIRHAGQSLKLVQAAERVKICSPVYSLEIYDDEELVATSYADENTWAGQKTLFISSIKTETGCKNINEIYDFVMNFYEKNAENSGYDAIMFELSNVEYRQFFYDRGYENIRQLDNFAGKRESIVSALSSRLNNMDFTNYHFVELRLEDIYKYSSFQDTRPGWNTSNLSIIKNSSNSMIALQDKVGKVYGICVYDGRLGLISRIAVHPMSRKIGLGGYIFNHVLRKMKNDEIFVIDILNESANSISFLRNLGFEPVESKFELHKELVCER